MKTRLQFSRKGRLLYLQNNHRVLHLVLSPLCEKDMVLTGHVQLWRKAGGCRAGHMKTYWEHWICLAWERLG